MEEDSPFVRNFKNLASYLLRASAEWSADVCLRSKGPQKLNPRVYPLWCFWHLSLSYEALSFCPCPPKGGEGQNGKALLLSKKKLLGLNKYLPSCCLSGSRWSSWMGRFYSLQSFDLGIPHFAVTRWDKFWMSLEKDFELVRRSFPGALLILETWSSGSRAEVASAV